MEWKSLGINQDYYIAPAPSMTELWLKLPDNVDGNYIDFMKSGYNNFAGYGASWNPVVSYKNTNPCDCLADLLIWVKKIEEG